MSAVRARLRAAGPLGAATAAMLVAAVVTASGYAVAAAGDAPALRGPGLVTLHVRIQHSRFELPEVRIAEGTTVRFVVRNDDPIAHELVVGDRSIHVAHERGTDAQHPPVPGEVSLEPGETGVTFHRFDEAGEVEYACHLPGHLRFGMRGTLEVVAAEG